MTWSSYHDIHLKISINHWTTGFTTECSRFWICSIFPLTLIYSYLPVFLCFPGFKRGADPGMPEPTVLRWVVWVGHVKLTVCYHRELKKMLLFFQFALGMKTLLTATTDQSRSSHWTPNSRESRDTDCLDQNVMLGCKYLAVSSTLYFSVLFWFLLLLLSKTLS